MKYIVKHFSQDEAQITKLIQTEVEATRFEALAGGFVFVNQDVQVAWISSVLTIKSE